MARRLARRRCVDLPACADAVFEKPECQRALTVKHDVLAMLQTTQARANLITESA
jgi:hypothetical protein